MNLVEVLQLCRDFLKDFNLIEFHTDQSDGKFMLNFSSSDLSGQIEFWEESDIFLRLGRIPHEGTHLEAYQEVYDLHQLRKYLEEQLLSYQTR